VKKLILALTLLATPAAALDVEFNSPSDQTPNTLIAVAKALGIWDTIHSAVVTGQIDAYGNQWSVYIEGLRYNCTGTYPAITCTPKGDGYWAHMRYTGPLTGVGAPPVIATYITIGGTQAAPTFTWNGATGAAPGSVTITVDDHTHAAWE